MRFSIHLSGMLAGLVFTTLNVAYAEQTLPATSIQALLATATQFEHAEGVPRDYAKAAALYCQAAKAGNANAQFALGWMYANGRGVDKNDAVAGQLFSMAAKQGHEGAINMTQFALTTKGATLPDCLTPDPIKPLEAVVVQTPVAPPNYQNNRAIFRMVEKIAHRYAIDPQLVMAIISVESGFNVHARSPKNAQGLMQLIPETAQRFKVKNSLDAEENIKGGVAYLNWLLAYFKGNVGMVAAAYNSGEGAVEKYRGIPPYPETQNYVRRVSQLYQKTDHPYQTGVVKASAFLANRKAIVQ